ncbi:DoxX family protein [Microbacterium sp. LTA6]|uniref:DoxX family protein n=1 Tax=unclassified Microbacterium TaxID=2609290 RepID=UPI00313970A3
MFILGLAITLLTAALNGAIAVLNLIGHDYPKSQADQMRIPHSLLPVFGTMLGAGSLGLVVGLAVPSLGIAAAAGFVIYYLVALGAHFRVRDFRLIPWATMFALACAALAVATFRAVGA